MSHNLPPAHLLEAGIQDLSRRQELLTREYEANAQLLAEALAAGTEVTGTGSGADGAIVATVGADHRLIELELEPPALRLGSIQRLREELKIAVNAAIDDAEAQLREAGGRAASPEVVGDLLDRMPEVTALLPDALREQLRRPAPSTPDGTIDAPDWKLDA